MRLTQAGDRFSDFLATPAVAVGPETYDWIDVVLAAMARGEWTPFVQQLAEGVACVARARMEQAPVSGDRLDEAATAFRYDRDLIAGAELNAWLDRVGISIDEWAAYLERRLLRERWRDSLSATLARFPPSHAQLADIAVVDGVCSGTFAACADALASRVALVADTGVTVGDVAWPAIDVGRLMTDHAAWLSAHSADDVQARIDRVGSLEARFRAACERLVADAPLESIVAEHRLEWQQIEFDTLPLPTEQAAREALLCIQVDKMSLHQVAALCRRQAERQRQSADEFADAQRDAILALEPGGVLGPIAVNGHYDVWHLRRRAAPTLDDGPVRERARRCVIDAAIRRATQQHPVRQWPG